MIVTISILLRRRNFYRKFVEKIKIYFEYFSINLDVYDAIWKNMIDQNRPQTKIQFGACTVQGTV
jgi:hypothetical protein